MHINGAVWLSGRTIVSPLLAGATEKRGQATLILTGDRGGARWIQVPGLSRAAVAIQECQTVVGG